MLPAPWAVRWVESPGYGRRVALGRAQSRLFGRLVAILGAQLGRSTFVDLPTQRELAAELGMTVGRVSDTLADLARLGLVDLRTVRGRLGSTAVRWTLRRWARRLRRVTVAPELTATIIARPVRHGAAPGGSSDAGSSGDQTGGAAQGPAGHPLLEPEP